MERIRDLKDVSGCDTFLIRQSKNDCFAATAFNIANRIRKHQQKMTSQSSPNSNNFKSESLNQSTEAKKTCQISDEILKIYRITVTTNYSMLIADTPTPFQQTFSSVEEARGSNEIWWGTADGIVKEGREKKIEKLYFTLEDADGEQFLDGGLAPALLVAVLWEGGLRANWTIAKVSDFTKKDMFDTNLRSGIHVEHNDCFVFSWMCLTKSYNLKRQVGARELRYLLNYVRRILLDEYPEHTTVAAGVGMKGKYFDRRIERLVPFRHAIALSPCDNSVVEGEGRTIDWLICDSDANTNECRHLEGHFLFLAVEDKTALVNIETIDFVIMRRE